MNIQEIKCHLAQFAHEVGATAEEFQFVNTLELQEGAELIEFKFRDVESSAIAMSDVVFCLNDWQSSYPTSEEEIEDYDWYSTDDTPAIILNGLPRIFA